MAQAQQTEPYEQLDASVEMADDAIVLPTHQRCATHTQPRGM